MKIWEGKIIKKSYNIKNVVNGSQHFIKAQKIYKIGNVSACVRE